MFPDIRTTDGATWHSIAGKMPSALAGEASFSSSGTCIATEGQRNAWISTGGSSIERILATRDEGDSWTAYDTPLVSNSNAGGFSVAFRDSRHGMVGGGDLTTNSAAQAATSADGGQTWKLTNNPPFQEPSSVWPMHMALNSRIGTMGKRKKTISAMNTIGPW